MDTNAKTIARVLVDQLEDLEYEAVPDVMKEFVAFLAENKLLGSWREIEMHIHKAWKEKYGVSKITVVSAHPLTELANEEIEKLAKGADIVRRVDERLIGGSVIRIDDKRIDGSIAGTLQKLKMTLSK
ncbi:hypothetical protein HN358_00965 [Candidatus Uhrbacteria bacterium]|jgi:F0F1-type ATP synthase delta subunit|nr:hypothetical protein [Candidatus Uhrbacteria bacterium]MBT7717456.1 hypothetical protein [Candidatus Uhrbacteria bacterium]